MAWWKRQQEFQVRESLRVVRHESAPVPTTSFVRADIPTVKDLALMDVDTLRQGVAFSDRMQEFGTSKFHDLGYQYIYGRALSHLEGASVRILEIGIGVNDPDAPSGMNESHEPGTSLRGWAEYFTTPEVHGADVDMRALINSDILQTHWTDQLSIPALQQLAAQVGGPLDLIVDDGLHTPEANANTLSTFLPLLAPAGVFVVEDIMIEFNYLWDNVIPSLIGPEFDLVFYPGNVLEPLMSKPRRVLSGLAIITRTSPDRS